MAALQEAAKNDAKNEIDLFGEALENFVIAVFDERAVKKGLFVADEDILKKQVKTAKAALIGLLTGVELGDEKD